MIELQTETDLFGTEVSSGVKIDRVMLAAGLYANLKDISLEEFVSYITNRFDASADYAALTAGENKGHKISLLFNPHRLDTRAKTSKQSLYEALKNENFISGLSRAVIFKQGKVSELLYQILQLGINGVTYINEFPPHVARKLALEHGLTKSSRVLDPCAGWGGRMIGFSTVVDSYTCCEPSTRTVTGLRKLHDWLRVFRSDFSTTIHEAPFEDVQFPPASFDFALTSPPYYDTERYADEPTNSFNRYSSFDAWCHGFYEPLIHRTMAALKPGAAFVLNVGSRVYPLSDRLMRIAADRYAVEKQKSRLSGAGGLGKEGEGETFYEIRNPAGTVIILTSPPAGSDVETQSQLPVEIKTVLAKPDATLRAPGVVSALDFAFRQTSSSTPPPEAAPTALRAALQAAGHRLLRRDGKLFVTHASTLTDDERAQIKLHKPALIQMAEEWSQDAIVPVVADGAVDIPDGLGNAIRGDDTGGGIAPSVSPIYDRGASREAEEKSDILPGSSDLKSREALDVELGVKEAALVPPSIYESRSTDGDVQAAHDSGVSAFGWKPSADEHKPTGGGSSPRVDASEQCADSLFTNDAPQVSLAQFLGSSVPQRDYTPDEPPDLTGIDEIVLNFATNGLNWHGGDRPVGVTVSTLDGKMTRFLPFAFAGGNLSEDAIKEWMRREVRGKKITNSKTKFDIHHAREWGVDLEAQGCNFSDIQHTAALLDDHRKRFALDVLAAAYFPGETFPARLDEARHHEHHASEVADRERTTAQLVGRLRAVMYPQIDAQELRAVHDLEDSVIPAVVEMERNGSPLNVELLEQFHAQANQRHDALLWEVAKECGFAFDHTPKSWQRLFETLGLPPTDGNAEAVIGGIDHPVVKKAHLAAQYASLDSKTFAAYQKNVGTDGILRFEINQLRSDDGGTVSGRFSIGYVQQVPNADNHSAVFGEELFPRKLFVAASGEYLEADAMQIEQRLLVHYADNKKITAQYDGDLERLQRGEETVSYHKITWAGLKEYKPDMLYGHTKNFNFAFQYGAKSIKLAVMMKFITEAEGNEIRQAKRWNDPRLKVIQEIEAAYNRMMPEGRALLDRAAHLAKPECDDFCKRGDALHRQYPHRGYVKTLLGRRSRFRARDKVYIGLNRVLQGTGADIMKAKLVELHRERAQTGFVMRLTVHDAVGGDATTTETKRSVSEILNHQSSALKVPILWSCGTGADWAGCK